MIRKGGNNWVTGEKFFDRQAELEMLEERVRDGIHTLLTAPRRTGKTSLVRELLRRLAETGEFKAVFVDLESASNAGDAIAEIGAQSRPRRPVWDQVAGFARSFGIVIEEPSVADLKMKLRARIREDNWREQGDAVFSCLAKSACPVVLGIEGLSMLVNRMLKDEAGRTTLGGKQETAAFLSWLRKAGQSHLGRVTMILSDSVSLEPVLEAARLSAQANIFAPYDLKPWSEETAMDCLGALAASYGVDLPPEVLREMCRRLRCCIPHHVQMFFDRMHNHLLRDRRERASPTDVGQVYAHEMLGVRGQADLQHYEDRLQLVLGSAGYTLALEMLTASAVDGELSAETVDRYQSWFSSTRDAQGAAAVPSVDHVLRMLQHDGYLESTDGGYRMSSGLLEDWWRGRYGQNFEPVFKPQ